MDDVAILFLIPAVLIGLNHLARNPRAQGRAWRVSRTLTRIGVSATVVGLPLLLLTGNPHSHHLSHTQGVGLYLYLGGLLAILLTLLLRLWLRFDAYLHNVGPANFAKGAANMGWTVGKSGLKLYGMALVALVAMHFVGLRNLLFLRILKGSVGGGPLFGDPDDPSRDEDGRHADAPPAS